MVKRDASCLLCGARMRAEELLDACGEIVDAGLGVLSCHCPYCQGYFEVMPVVGNVNIGYLRNQHFDVALVLPCEGLTVERTTDGVALKLDVAGRHWKFREFVS